MNNNSTTKYCDLSKFSANYRNSHGYLALLVCLFGSIANSLNICVLSAKEMRVPTNFILTGLAVSDLLVMLEYIPYSIHVYFDPIARMRPDYFSYPWAVYTYFHALFTQICHFISICLTVMLAVWRYVAITHPQNNKIWCNPKRTKIGIILSYILCPFICTPLFLGLIIKEYPRQTYPNGTIIQMTDNVTYEGNRTNVVIYALYFHDSYENINLWMYGVVIKLLPCILLTVLSVFLIKALLDAKKRWKTLSHSSGVPLVNSEKKQKDIEKNHQVDRTTRMLLAVLLLFLLTEFPQAMLGLISGILGHDFYNYCYMPLGDLMDMAALANSAINFILYCSMSQQFRTEFHKIFVKKCLRLCGRDKNVPSETNSHTKITVL